jgi:kumamolisin
MDSYDNVFQTAAPKGITICVASGNNGSGDGVRDGMYHADFPASSPNVLACGGTSLPQATISSEVV